MRNFRQLTRRIQKLEPLRGIVLPGRKEGRQLWPDITHRYFTEDFECGLGLIVAIGQIAQVATPQLSEALRWYELITRRNVLSVETSTRNTHSAALLPISLGITTVSELVNPRHARHRFSASELSATETIRRLGSHRLSTE